MITERNWESLKAKQAELDKLIVKKSPIDLKWVSYSNAERLKLALLVEVGEFANEIKSFKAWRKQTEISWDKAKEELIDCLGYFLGLVNIYQIETDFSFVFPQRENLTKIREGLETTKKKLELEIKEKSQIEKFEASFNQKLTEIVSKIENFNQLIYSQKDIPFNQLLLEFFYKTNDLYIAEITEFQAAEKTSAKKNLTTPLITYWLWLSIFNKLCEKLTIDEKELGKVYLDKNKINQQRAKAK